MVWHGALVHKAWLDTRWRFLIGLGLTAVSAGLIVFTYDDVLALLPAAAQVDRRTALGRQLAEQAALVGDYRSYIWSQWVRDDLRQLFALFAVLIGAGGLLSQASRGGATYMLSLPVTRAQILWSRAGVGLAELAVLAMVPPLLLAALSPLAGQAYSLTDALVHGGCMFVAGSTLSCLTMLLSTVFSDVWSPPIIVLCLTLVMQFVRELLGTSPSSSLLGVMTAETWFRSAVIPVPALLIAAAVSAAVLHVATLTLARRDF